MLRGPRYVREYSLLSNPRTPAEVLANAATTSLMLSPTASVEDRDDDDSNGGSGGGSSARSPRTELARLRSHFSQVKLLTIPAIRHVDDHGSHNCPPAHGIQCPVPTHRHGTVHAPPQVDELYRYGLLSDDVAARLGRELPAVSGGWCCAPKRDTPAMPSHHSFRLPLLPSAGLLEGAGGGGGGGVMASLVAAAKSQWFVPQFGGGA